MALPPPLDSGGEGKQRVGAQSNGGGSSREDIPRRKPRGGKRELSERQAERYRVPLWTYGERERFLHRGSTLPPPETERCAVPSPSRPPTQPRLPPPPCATRVSAKGERKRDKSQAHGA